MTLVFPQLALAKTKAFPRSVVDIRLQSANPKMLRRVAARQFNSLTWDTRTMTKPKEGLARNYTFLVTSFTPDGGTNYLNDRKALSREPLFFASVISDLTALHLHRGIWSAGKPRMRTNTFFNMGFILSARPKNVALNCPGDTAFSIRKPYPETLAALRKHLYQNYPGALVKVGSDKPYEWPHYRLRRVGPYDPKHILDRTNERSNEVLMHGTYGGSEVQPAALFVRTDPLTNKDLVPADQLAPYIDAARRWNIPLVRIPAYGLVHNDWSQPKENARYLELLFPQLKRAFHGKLPTEDWRKKVWD
ncbi:MAG: hypothetical protein JRH20_30230 [Deltaproteobacteria bacterium]|nr:hypothetical protein [Deltaproteobacteria bacterium]